jgi:dephospho-CoA kinase
MKWTGLTGGIATGKSTAKKLIESLGFPVIDADQISHQLTDVGQLGYERILSHFGQTIINADQTLNRQLLGRMIFSDEKQKNALEAILHPLIREQVLHEKELHRKSGAKICFYDVPLLFEKKLWNDFDATVLIWCDEETQLERLMKRNQLSEAEARLRMANQLSMIEKVKLADYCVDNSTTVEELEKQLQRLIKKFG